MPVRKGRPWTIRSSVFISPSSARIHRCSWAYADAIVCCLVCVENILRRDVLRTVYFCTIPRSDDDGCRNTRGGGAARSITTFRFSQTTAGFSRRRVRPAGRKPHQGEEGDVKKLMLTAADSLELGQIPAHCPDQMRVPPCATG